MTQTITMATTTSTSSPNMNMKNTFVSDHVVLNIIRVIALYIYVCFTKATNVFHIINQEVEDVAQDKEEDEEDLEALQNHLLPWIEEEMLANNQEEGLFQEEKGFEVLTNYFTTTHTKAKLTRRRYHFLIHCLFSYLKNLCGRPIVVTRHQDLLHSTLEYLRTQESISTPLLYPLVNAIDSLSTEKRECLNALTLLWKMVQEKTQKPSIFLEQIAIQTHHLLFCMDQEEDQKDQLVEEETTQQKELGLCFVKILVAHSDHIFRRDFSSLIDLESHVNQFILTDQQENENKEVLSEQQQTTTNTIVEESNNNNNNIMAEFAEEQPVAAAVTGQISTTSSLQRFTSSSSKSARKKKSKASIQPLNHHHVSKMSRQKNEQVVDDDALIEIEMNRILHETKKGNQLQRVLQCVGIAAGTIVAAAICYGF